MESPYAGNVRRNLRYLQACMADCLRRGEAPFASHGLYTQPGVLDDKDPWQRALGITAGCAWRPAAAATVAYMDLGESGGMLVGLADARRCPGHEIEYRWLGGEWTKDRRPNRDECRADRAAATAMWLAISAWFAAGLMLGWPVLVAFFGAGLIGVGALLWQFRGARWWRP